MGFECIQVNISLLASFGRTLAVNASDMKLMIWTEEMSVGVDIIDADHQKLFMLLNRLGYSIREQSSRPILGQVLRELSDYTDYHFEREEILMEVCEYPEIDRHKRIHRALRAQVANYLQAFQRDPAAVDISQFREFLNHWLVEHIMVKDKEYETWMAGKQQALKLANARFERSLQ